MVRNSNHNSGFGQRNVGGGSAIQRRGDMAGSVIRDRGASKFGAEVAKEEAIAPKIFFYNKQFVFWSMIVIFTVMFGYLIVDKGVYTFAAIMPKVGTWALCIAITTWMLKSGRLDDKPESDLRAFFVKGPWFRLGGLFGAGYFLWMFGYEWIWAYDLTDTNMEHFKFGFTSLSQAAIADAPVGLAGFLMKLVPFIEHALFGGIIVAAIARKFGLNTADTTNNDAGN